MPEGQPSTGGRGAEHLARFFRALASEPRLRLLWSLKSGPRRVSDLVQELGMSQGRVSAHLRLLADCGLVLAYRVDGQRYYRVVDAQVVELLELTEVLLEVT